MKACEVVGNDCTEPAGWRTGNGSVRWNMEADAKYECYRCGKRACKACSKVVKKQRICWDCLEEENER